jgi:hypothetical protein
MKTEIANLPNYNATRPSELGLTSEDLKRATDRPDSTELNLECSDLACHIATNEFELVFLCNS